MFFRRPVEYVDSNFSLTLPPRWKRVDDATPDLVSFSAPDGKQRFSVSVAVLAQRAENDEQVQQAARDVYDARIKAERQFLAPEDPLMAGGVKTGGVLPVGFFQGAQKSTGRLFMGWVLANRRRVVTLYFEGFTPEVAAHMKRGTEIAKTLKLY